MAEAGKSKRGAARAATHSGKGPGEGPGARALFLAVAFLAGWVIMMLEILGGRVLAPYFGYSVYQWGALIGVVMAALACGYYLGGRLGDRPGARAFLAWALAASALFVLIVPRLAELFLPAMRAAGPAWGAVAASAVLLGVPSALLATTSPIVIRLTASERIANSAGVVYAVSTVGSIGGTFFTAFYAIPELGSRLSHFVAAALICAALAALALATRRTRAAAVAGVALVIGYPLPVGPEPGVVYSAESLHNIIRVEDAGDWRYLYLNYTEGAQTVMAKKRLLTGGYYDFFLLGPHINGAKSVLFLGAAGGTALRQLVGVYPDLEVTGVELDPAVIAVAKRYFGLAGLPRLRLVADDARWHLSRSTRRYDMIAIDLYVTGHIPFFTTTREFFELVRQRLEPDGLLMMNILAQSHAEQLVGPFVRTVRAVFPSAFLVGAGNYILIATAKPMSLAALRRALARRGRTAEVGEVLRRALESARAATSRRRWPVFTDDRNDVELRTFRSYYGRG